MFLLVLVSIYLSTWSHSLHDLNFNTVASFSFTLGISFMGKWLFNRICLTIFLVLKIKVVLNWAQNPKYGILEYYCKLKEFERTAEVSSLWTSPPFCSEGSHTTLLWEWPLYTQKKGISLSLKTEKEKDLSTRPC